MRCLFTDSLKNVFKVVVNFNVILEMYVLWHISSILLKGLSTIHRKNDWLELIG